MKNCKILLPIILFLCTGTLFAVQLPLPATIPSRGILQSKITNAAHNLQLEELKQFFQLATPEEQAQRFYNIAYEGDKFAPAIQAMLEAAIIPTEVLNTTLAEAKTQSNQKIVNIITQELLKQERLKTEGQRRQARQQSTIPIILEPDYLGRLGRH